MAPHVRVEPAAPSTPEGAVEPAAPSNPEGAFVPVAYPVASYPVACSPMPYPVPYPVACPVACSPMPPVANPQQQQQLHVPDGWHGDDLGQLHGPDGWHWDDPGQPRAEVRVQVGGHAHPHALLVRRRVVEQLERRALDAERSLEEAPPEASGGYRGYRSGHHVGAGCAQTGTGPLDAGAGRHHRDYAP